MTKPDLIIHDESHMTTLYGLDELRARIGRIQVEIDSDPTCGFGEGHTGPPLYRPEGPRCGAPATHVIFWDDGQWSLGCEEHLGPFEPEAPPCYIVRTDMGSHGETGGIRA